MPANRRLLNSSSIHFANVCELDCDKWNDKKETVE